MTSEMQPALDEIAAIYKKHGLAGAVSITNGTTIDYRMWLEAPWSCAKDEFDADGQLVAVRLKCTPADIPEKAKRAALVNATLASLAGIVQANIAQNEKVATLMRMAAKYVNVTTRLDTLE